MKRYFKRYVLLIEFDESIPFKLYDTTVDHSAGQEISPASIIAKISLLCIHFPQLQVIWSRSPAQTVDYFKMLKENQSQPDIEKIEKVGKLGKMDEADDEDEFGKYLHVEFLRKLPGINSNNLPIVAKRVRNVTELTKMSEDDLKGIIGQKNARELKGFLDREIDVLTSRKYE